MKNSSSYVFLKKLLAKRMYCVIFLLFLFMYVANSLATEKSSQNSGDNLSKKMVGTVVGNGNYISQQIRIITGKVTDAQGAAIIGANIVEVGTFNGTVTDIEGHFTLNINRNSSIKVSYIGYIDQIIDVAEESKLNIVLIEDTQSLDELVVVGYGTQRKSDLTGAISSVNVERTLETMPTAQIADLLQGRVAGLSVLNSSGAPGSSANLRIRGVNSITADGGPLVVVDGFPGASISTINPADIKSIEVLKDASSTAIYGSRGANGVILITTKTPQKNITTVNYSGYVEVGTPYNLPELMSAGDFAMMANDWSQIYNGSKLYSDTQIKNFENGYDTFDYMDNLINRYVISHSNDLSVSGGNDKSNYLLSFKYTHDEGVAGISYNDRVNYRLKLDSDINSRLRIGANFYGIVNSAQSNSFSGAYSLLTMAQRFPQTVLPYDNDGNPTVGTIDNTATHNPMVFLDEQKRNNNMNFNFQNWFQAYLNLQLIDGLTFRSDFQFSTGNSYHGITNSTKSFSGVSSGLSNAEYYDNNSWGVRNSNVFNYTKEFNENNRINSMIGMEQGLSNGYRQRIRAQGLISEKIGWKNLLLASTVNPTESSTSTSTSLSYFGRINYVLMNKYMATFTVRRDGSSSLAYDNRWDTFPSFSLAWDLKNESFLNEINSISQLKVRFGYGISGNQAVPAYSAFSTYQATRGNEGLITYTLSPGNQVLRWEKTHQSNYGLDAGFLNNRITINVDYYDKKTDGAINRVILPDDTGQSSRLMNSAIITNKGIEGTLGIIPISTNEFYWKTDVSFAKNEAIIEKLGDIDSEFMELGNSWGDTYFRFYEGQRIGTLYGLKSDGVWTTDEISNTDVAKPISPVVRPGSYKYVDQPDENGETDGIINADDYVIIGDGQPVFNWGMNNQFNYKNFDLNLFFVGFHGFDIYNYPRSILTNTLSPYPELAERWIEGTNENAIIAGFGQDRDARSNELVASSTFVEKGDFIKLKNITLGYTIPNIITSNINLRSIRAYLSVQNVHTFTNYSGNDPEMAVSQPLRPGLDMGAYPSTRQLLVGVTVLF